MLDIKAVIASRLRQCRTDQGWSAEVTAKRLSVLPSRYSNWEQGIRAPKYEQIFDLAELFGKPPAWIAGFTDVEGQPANPLNFIAVNQSTISVKDTVMQLERVSDDSAFNISYIKRRGLNENKLTTILAPDDSMTGKKDLIKEGDELLIDRAQNTANKADLFAILVNGQIWVRWIRPEINGNYTIAAEDSEHYPDNELNKDELANIKIIGRITRISRDR